MIALHRAEPEGLDAPGHSGAVGARPAPMPASYRDAAEALYRAPHEAWVAERKRLAAELKAAGDKAGAAQLAKLARPPLSAWVVNQLWWRAPEPFAELLAAAA